jgi:hypothetical protein
MATVTLAKIDAQIASFTTNRNKLRELGHEIGMMILRHAAPKEVSDDCSGSGDCTRALKLMREMPKSWAAQMDNWFRQFSPIRVVVKNDKCEFDPAYKKLSKDDKLKAWRLEDAAQTPFYELDEPEVQGKPLDFMALVKMVEQLSKRIETRVEKGEVLEEDIPSALDIAKRLSGLKLKRIRPASNDKAEESGEGNVTNMPKPKKAANG